MLNHKVQVKDFDPVVLVGELPYRQVRAEQLHAPAQTGFSKPFLYHLQNHLLEAMYARLKARGDRKTEEMLDTLVMLVMLIGKVEFGKLNGMDAETLDDVVMQSTRLTEW